MPFHKEISEKVTYQTEYGKIHHVSLATITNIKHSHLKKDYIEV